MADGGWQMADGRWEQRLFYLLSAYRFLYFGPASARPPSSALCSLPFFCFQLCQFPLCLLGDSSPSHALQVSPSHGLSLPPVVVGAEGQAVVRFVVAALAERDDVGCFHEREVVGDFHADAAGGAAVIIDFENGVAKRAVPARWLVQSPS